MSNLTLIVAATKTNGIGKNGNLPWRLPKEMKYFARVTSGAPEGFSNMVIMGRNTWESIPAQFRPLPKRLNVVISRNSAYELFPETKQTEEAHLYPNLLSALNFAPKDRQIHRKFIIGGNSLYAETLGGKGHSMQDIRADRVLLTRILEPAFEDCDTFMPNFLSSDPCASVAWQRASHGDLETWVGGDVPKGVQEEKGVKYEFEMWLRRE
ncbi:hypothetical protein CONPUDRAFT_95552 [Coniophora puteana RWD-64-598 SS2]|uniref:Dihydrofolate reductase n=1 Tax=Coniophora puteana (strain RWD-64-598) TaxID=741705 RepID=A0A5M3N7D2_CONPW|nr:uncharacterized protein CONPUDRAFT_95552 [Coniophora puteana RWD-64-598 SS2]EIW86745.1 hypothetical protein CONPUDRAFT_95552 [Coniophora puteana RWD-64-598 SS2]